MGCLASVLATGLCCCFQCCCKQISQSCKRLLGEQRVTKLFYMILVVVYVVPAILVFFLINNWKAFLDYFRNFINCPPSSGQGLQCIGASAIYRISFSLLCLFLIMMLVMFCRNRCSMVVNEGLFCFKYLFVVGLFIGLLWVSNSVFDGYAQASKYISIVFMVLQSIILIDLFYLAGIKLVKRFDKGQTEFACCLVFWTIIAESLAIGLNVIGYIWNSTIWYTDTPCSSTLWVNIVTSIILVALPVLQLFNFNTQNSLLTTALVSMYISYLSYIAQFSFTNGNDDAKCNRMTVPSLVSDVIASTLFFIITMYGTIMGGTGQVKITANGDVNKAVGIAPTQVKQADEHREVPIQKSQEDQHELQNQKKYSQSWLWVKWHFHMSLAAIYVGMLITNWTSASIVTGGLGPSGFGFWVRVSIAWATTLIYIWTLIAPKICPDRDFVVE